MGKQVGPDSPYQKTLIVDIDPEVHHKLKVIAAHRKIMLSQLLRQLFDDMIELYEKRHGPISLIEEKLSEAQRKRLYK